MTGSASAGPDFLTRGQDFLCLIEEGCPQCKKLIEGEEKAGYSSIEKDKTGRNCLKAMTEGSDQTLF